MRPRNPDRRRVSGHRWRDRMGLNLNPWTASNPSSLTPAASLGSFLRLRAVAGLASYGRLRAWSYDRSTADPQATPSGMFTLGTRHSAPPASVGQLGQDLLPAA